MRNKLLIIMLLAATMTYGQLRQQINLKNWEFSRDNSTWEQVQEKQK